MLLCLHCVHPVRNVLGKEILECNTTPNNFEVSDNITICSYRSSRIPCSPKADLYTISKVPRYASGMLRGRRALPL